MVAIRRFLSGPLVFIGITLFAELGWSQCTNCTYPYSTPIRTALDSLPIDRGLHAVVAGDPIPLYYYPVDASGVADTTALDRIAEVMIYNGPVSDLDAHCIPWTTFTDSIYTLSLQRNELCRLLDLQASLIHVVELTKPIQPQLDKSIEDINAACLRKFDKPKAPDGKYSKDSMTGKGIIIGIVDSGIDFKSPDFIDLAGNSRILYLWDQTQNLTAPVDKAKWPKERKGDRDKEGNVLGSDGPDGKLGDKLDLGIGVEWVQSEITNEIKNAPGKVTQKDEDGHGTYVAGIAAGSGAQTGCAPAKPKYRYVGVAPEADLIIVKTLKNTDGLVAALAYISYRARISKATAAGKPRRCAVNVSQGFDLGPHDGTDAVSKWINQLRDDGVVVVVSAGNNGEMQWHRRLTNPLNVGANDFTIDVPAYNQVGSAAQKSFTASLWYSKDVRLNAEVIGPSGVGGGSVVANYNGIGEGDIDDGTVTILNKRQTGDNGDKSNAINIVLRGRPGPPKVWLAQGAWILRITPANPGNNNKATDLDLWIVQQTLGDVTKRPTVQNSDLKNTVEEPGNASGAITVAAHTTKNAWVKDCVGNNVNKGAPPIGQIAPYSGRGPGRGPHTPDISAPGSWIAATRSRDINPALPYDLGDDEQHIVAEGTSAAAPHVAGAAALYLQKYPDVDAVQVRTALSSTASNPNGGGGGAFDADTWGGGKLNVFNALKKEPKKAAFFRPRGGDVWVAASTKPIEVELLVNAPLDSILLEYSVDDGAHWASIATVTDSTLNQITDTYWLVPNLVTSLARIRCTAWAGCNNDTLIVSDRFAIASPTPRPRPCKSCAWATMLPGAEIHAEADRRQVTVRWSAQGDQITAFRVLRSTLADGHYEPVGQELPASVTGSYSFQDRTAQRATEYFYRVCAREPGGEWIQSDPVQVITPAPALAFVSAAPNPSSGTVRLEYETDAASPAQVAKIEIYDVAGRRVRQLFQGSAAPGVSQVTWDGTGESGRRLAAGVYVAKLSLGDRSVSRKLLIKP
jgi:subtilisin family serine protease